MGSLAVNRDCADHDVGSPLDVTIWWSVCGGFWPFWSSERKNYIARKISKCWGFTVNISQAHGQKWSEKDRATLVFWFEGLSEANNSFASRQKNALFLHFNLLVFLIFLLKPKRSSHCDFSAFLAWYVTSEERSKQLAAISVVCLRNRCCFCAVVAEANPQYHHRAFRPSVASWNLWTRTIWMADSVKHLFPSQALVFLFIDLATLTN